MSAESLGKAREIVEAWRAGHRGSFVWQDTLGELEERIAAAIEAVTPVSRLQADAPDWSRHHKECRWYPGTKKWACHDRCPDLAGASHSDAPSGAAPDRDVIVEALREALTWIHVLHDHGTLTVPRIDDCEYGLCIRLRRLLALDSAQRGAGSPRPGASDAGASATTLADKWIAWALARDLAGPDDEPNWHDAIVGAVIDRDGQWIDALRELRAPAPRLGEAAPAVREEHRGGE